MDCRFALCIVAASTGFGPCAVAAKQFGPHPMAQARAVATIHNRAELKGGQLRIDDAIVEAAPAGPSVKTRTIDVQGLRVRPDIPTPGWTLIIVDLP